MPYSRIFLGLGSNVERDIHLSIGLTMLAEQLRGIRCSPVFESVSTDGSGPSFFNLVIAAETDLPLHVLVMWLKEIEYIHGRRANGRPDRVTLDIDLLLYDDWVGTFEGVELPRPEILKRSYVLYPLSLIAPKTIHPKVGLCFHALWRRKSVGPNLKLVTEQLQLMDNFCIALS
jgi:2-amino-4-hydroxy-6-hydroxymethyldihydropteridine diphosphokinase